MYFGLCLKLKSYPSQLVSNPKYYQQLPNKMCLLRPGKGIQFKKIQWKKIRLNLTQELLPSISKWEVRELCLKGNNIFLFLFRFPPLSCKKNKNWCQSSPTLSMLQRCWSSFGRMIFASLGLFTCTSPQGAHHHTGWAHSTSRISSAYRSLFGCHPVWDECPSSVTGKRGSCREVTRSLGSRKKDIQIQGFFPLYKNNL